MKAVELSILLKLQKEVHQNSIDKGFYHGDELILQLLKTAKEQQKKTEIQELSNVMIIREIYKKVNSFSKIILVKLINIIHDSGMYGEDNLIAASMGMSDEEYQKFKSMSWQRRKEYWSKLKEKELIKVVSAMTIIESDGDEDIRLCKELKIDQKKILKAAAEEWKTKQAEERTEELDKEAKDAK